MDEEKEKNQEPASLNGVEEGKKKTEKWDDLNTTGTAYWLIVSATLSVILIMSVVMYITAYDRSFVYNTFASFFQELFDPKSLLNPTTSSTNKDNPKERIFNYTHWGNLATQSGEIKNVSLKSYKVLILLTLIFAVIFVPVLIHKYPKGFRMPFPYEVLLAIPIIYISESLFKSFDNEGGKSIFAPLYMLISCCLGVFAILAVSGVLSDSPSPNAHDSVYTLFACTVFFFVARYIYNQVYSQIDAPILAKTVPGFRDAFHSQTTYTIALIAFLCFVGVIAHIPAVKQYEQYLGFFSLSICVLLLLAIVTSTINHEAIKFNSWLALIIRWCIILGVLAAIIYGITLFFPKQSSTEYKMYFSAAIIFIVEGILLYMIVSQILKKILPIDSPLYQLVKYGIMYIPCLIQEVLYTAMHELNVEKIPDTTPMEWKLAGVATAIFVSYFLITKTIQPLLYGMYLKQGGKQIVNEPVGTDTEHVVSSVLSFSALQSEENKYAYGLSFWYYLDSFQQHDGIILSYGGNPVMRYNAENNTILYQTEQDEEMVGKEKKEGKERENIGKKWNQHKEKEKDKSKEERPGAFIDENVKLQKWNHVFFNYTNGTMDIFINGKMAKSIHYVLSYSSNPNIVIGQNNGVYGNVANMIYYDSPQSYFTINTLYESLKSSSPPIV
jgi:hypothetical protein